MTTNTLKTLGAVTIIGLASACQTYYQKHNTLNNGESCPQGTQADKYGMECKPVVKEIIPENETKLQKFNRVLGKVGKGIRENTGQVDQDGVAMGKLNNGTPCPVRKISASGTYCMK